MTKKALIAMSGGVDSSVTALLMQKAGYNCIGATMKLYTDNGQDCRDAKDVCEKLGMEHHIFDFSDKFSEKVIENFVSAYKKGQTPNPCIECNKYLKFDGLYQKMLEMGAEKIATGHYARVEFSEKTGEYVLKKALNKEKDQSYVLYNLSKEQLSHICFPLGGLTKQEVRDIAFSHGFESAGKKESQDICFVPDGKYADFIQKHTGQIFPQGDFVKLDGNILGKHRGIINYTIGQRKGLGISYTEPLFVCDICPEENKVVLGRNDDLFSDTLIAGNINIISGSFEKETPCLAKIRYRHTEQPATAQVKDGKLYVKFETPQRAITKGQAVVLYDGDIVLGGGTIEKAGVAKVQNSKKQKTAFLK